MSGRRRLTAVVALIATFSFGATASAFWRAQGAGTGSATAASLSAPGAPARTGGAGTSVALAWTAADVGGSSAGVTYRVERSADGGGTWVNACGTSSGATIGATSCTDSAAAGTYVYRVTAVYRSWTAVGGTSGAIVADATAPDFGSPALSLTGTGSAYVSGTTAYYNGTSGSLTVSAPNVSDGESGVATVSFPSIAGFSGGGAVSASPFTTTYSWSASSAGGAQTVTATNGVGLSSSAGFSLVRDVTPPTGGALTVAGASTDGATAYNGTGTYSIASIANFAEAQSATAAGLASSTLVRDDAPLSGDTCGTYTAAGRTPISAVRTENASTGIVGGRCYRYTLTGTDNVGNSATFRITVKVDTTAPAFGTSPFGFQTTGGFAYYPGTGTSVYYNPANGAGSSIRVTPNVSDGETGIAKVTFPSISGFSGGGDVFGSPFGATYTWSAATASGAQTVTAANLAAGTASSAFTLVPDGTAPTGGALTVNGTAASAAGSASWTNTGTFAAGSRTDYGESSGSGLAGSVLTLRQGTLANSGGSCSYSGAPRTITGPPPAASGLAEGCYLYTLTGADQVANQASVSTTVKVDKTAPTASAGAATLSGSGSNTTLALVLNSNENTGGVNFKIYKTGASTPTCDVTVTTVSGSAAPYAYTSPACTVGNKGYTAQATHRDAAGNVSAVLSWSG